MLFFSYDLIFMKLYLSGFVSFELFSGDSLAAVGRWGGGVSIWDPTTFYMGSDDLRFVKWGFLNNCLFFFFFLHLEVVTTAVKWLLSPHGALLQRGGGLWGHLQDHLMGPGSIQRILESIDRSWNQLMDPRPRPMDGFWDH